MLRVDHGMVGVCGAFQETCFYLGENTIKTSQNVREGVVKH